MADNRPFYCLTLAAKLSGKNSQSQVLNQNQIDQISQNLREQISKSIKEMKGLSTEGSSESPQAQSFMPIFYMLSQEVNVVPAETPKKKGRKTSTKVLRNFIVSYEIPLICVEENIDLDNFVLYGESGSNTNKPHQFSFIQRLQSWTLQQRERSSKMRDVYYNHMISGSTFRSMKEVVNFMIFEKYPPKPSNEKDKKPQAGEGSVAGNESLGKEKRKGDGEIDELAMDKEKVAKFLAEAHDNLMNWRPRRYD